MTQNHSNAEYNCNASSPTWPHYVRPETSLEPIRCFITKYVPLHNILIGNNSEFFSACNFSNNPDLYHAAYNASTSSTAKFISSQTSAIVVSRFSIEHQEKNNQKPETSQKFSSSTQDITEKRLPLVPSEGIFHTVFSNNQDVSKTLGPQDFRSSKNNNLIQTTPVISTSEMKHSTETYTKLKSTTIFNKGLVSTVNIIVETPYVKAENYGSLSKEQTIFSTTSDQKPWVFASESAEKMKSTNNTTQDYHSETLTKVLNMLSTESHQATSISPKSLSYNLNKTQISEVTLESETNTNKVYEDYQEIFFTHLNFTIKPSVLQETAEFHITEPAQQSVDTDSYSVDEYFTLPLKTNLNLSNLNGSTSFSSFQNFKYLLKTQMPFGYNSSSTNSSPSKSRSSTLTEYDVEEKTETMLPMETDSFTNTVSSIGKSETKEEISLQREGPLLPKPYLQNVFTTNSTPENTILNSTQIYEKATESSNDGDHSETHLLVESEMKQYTHEMSISTNHSTKKEFEYKENVGRTMGMIEENETDIHQKAVNESLAAVPMNIIEKDSSLSTVTLTVKHTNFDTETPLKATTIVETMFSALTTTLIINFTDVKTSKYFTTPNIVTYTKLVTSQHQVTDTDFHAIITFDRSTNTETMYTSIATTHTVTSKQSDRDTDITNKTREVSTTEFDFIVTSDIPSSVDMTASNSQSDTIFAPTFTTHLVISEVTNLNSDDISTLTQFTPIQQSPTIATVTFHETTVECETTIPVDITTFVEATYTTIATTHATTDCDTTRGQIPSVSMVILEGTNTEFKTTITVNATTYVETKHTSIVTTHVMNSTLFATDTDTTTVPLEATTTECDTIAANHITSSIYMTAKHSTIFPQTYTTLGQSTTIIIDSNISTLVGGITTDHDTPFSVDTTTSALTIYSNMATSITVTNTPVATETNIPTITFEATTTDCNTTAHTTTYTEITYTSLNAISLITVTGATTTLEASTTDSDTDTASDITSSLNITTMKSRSDTTFAQPITIRLVTSEAATLNSDDSSFLAQFTTLEETATISTVPFHETTTECETTIIFDTTTFDVTNYTYISTTHSMTSTSFVRDKETTTTTSENRTTDFGATSFKDFTSSVEYITLNSDDTSISAEITNEGGTLSISSVTIFETTTVWETTTFNENTTFFETIYTTLATTHTFPPTIREKDNKDTTTTTVEVITTECDTTVITNIPSSVDFTASNSQSDTTFEQTFTTFLVTSEDPTLNSDDISILAHFTTIGKTPSISTFPYDKTTTDIDTTTLSVTMYSSINTTNVVTATPITRGSNTTKLTTEVSTTNCDTSATNDLTSSIEDTTLNLADTPTLAQFTTTECKTNTFIDPATFSKTIYISIATTHTMTSMPVRDTDTTTNTPLATSQDKTLHVDNTSILAKFPTTKQTPRFSSDMFEKTITEHETTNSNNTATFSETIYTSFTATHSMNSIPTVKNTDTTTTTLEVNTSDHDTTITTGISFYADTTVNNSQGDTTFTQKFSTLLVTTQDTTMNADDTSTFSETIYTTIATAHTIKSTPIFRDTDFTTTILQVSMSDRETTSAKNFNSTVEDSSLNPDDISSLAKFTSIRQTPSISTVVFDETTTECETTISVGTITFSETISISTASTHTVTFTPIAKNTHTTTTTLKDSTTDCDTTVTSDITSFVNIPASNSFPQTIHSLSSKNPTLKLEGTSTLALFTTAEQTPASVSTVKFDKSTTECETTISFDTMTFSVTVYTSFAPTHAGTSYPTVRDTDTTTTTHEVSSTNLDSTAAYDFTSSVEAKTLNSDDTSSLGQLTTVGQTLSIPTLTFDETTTDCETIIFDDTTTFSETTYTFFVSTDIITSAPIVRDRVTTTTTLEVSTSYCDTT